MIEVTFKDQDGNEEVLLDSRDWLLNDPKALAEIIAEDEMKDAGGDLSDPAQWPRKYEILIKGHWVAATVDLEYVPSFNATVNSQRETPNHE